MISATPSRPRMAAAVLLGLGALWCSFFFTVVAPLHPPAVRVPLLLAGERLFPVPVWHWLGVGLYAWAYGQWYGLPARERWSRALQLGLSLHVLFLIATIPGYLVEAKYAFSSPWYARYYHACWHLIVAGGVIAIGWMLREWMAHRRSDPYVFWLPLALGYGLFWTVSVQVTPSSTAIATAAGLIGAVVSGWMAGAASVRAGLRRLRAFASSEWVFLALVIALALGVRLFYVSRVMIDPAFVTTGSDGPLYDDVAWSLAQGHGFPDKVRQDYTFLVPGYIQFVALIYRLAGRSYLAVCVAQSLMGAAACLLVYAIGKRLFGSPAGRLAAVFAAIDFPMIFAAAALGHQAVDIFWTTLSIWLLIRHVQSPRMSLWASGGLGLLLGWATVTRESNIVFWAFVVGWLLTVFRRRAGWGPACRHALWLTLGFLAVLAPFIYTEVIKPGCLTASTTENGLRLRLSKVYFYNAVYPDAGIVNPVLDPSAAWHQLLAEPLRVVGYVGKNIWGNVSSLLISQGYGGFDPVFWVRGSEYYFGMWGYVYLFTLAGAWFMIRQIRRGAAQAWGMWMVLLFLAARISVHLVLETAYRHRAPLDPMLIVVAACGFLAVFGAFARPSAGSVS